MRGLYWLTAITLVAAAVTTVAIADYSRRHAGPIAGVSGGPAPKPVMTLMQTEDPAPTPVFVKVDEPKRCEGPCPAAGIPVEQVPEHAQLKAATLGGLSVMQDPPTPPVCRQGETKYPTPPAPAVVADEFSFPGTTPPVKAPVGEPRMLEPAPAWVPGTPAAPVSALPKSVPDFKPDLSAGPEVLPGLRAVNPEPKPEDDHPIQDCLQGSAELVTLLTPHAYLQSLPAAKAKCDGATCPQGHKAEAFALAKTFDGPDQLAHPALPAPACPGLTDSCTAKACAPAVFAADQAAAQCPTAGCCAKESAACCAAKDEVVVRTYSVAEFTTSSSDGYQDLIELVTHMIAPESWATKDSSVVYFAQGKCLVVRHRASVQTQVEDLLTQLRTAVQKHTTTRLAVLPAPLVRMEPTRVMPGELELVPLPPVELPTCRPRVITNEAACLGDDEFFGMVPTRLDGRLMPVPARLDANPLVPAGFVPSFLDEGPAAKVAERRVPEFFPLVLPYAPLPSGPETCEEEKIRTVDVQKSALDGPAKPKK